MHVLTCLVTVIRGIYSLLLFSLYFFELNTLLQHNFSCDLTYMLYFYYYLKVFGFRESDVYKKRL